MAFKYFGKWGVEGVSVKDPGIQKYIRLELSAPVMRSGGRHSKKQFGKAELPIVERLINKVMRSGPGSRKLGGKVIRGAGACGKKYKAYNTVRRSFEIIEQKAKKNPVQVLVNAIQNAAPREETTRISYGGVTYHLAVDSAPQRRLDIALKNIAGGAFAASFKSKKPIEECLAEELIMAANYDMKSFAIARKEETERIARGAR